MFFNRNISRIQYVFSSRWLHTLASRWLLSGATPYEWRDNKWKKYASYDPSTPTTRTLFLLYIFIQNNGGLGISQYAEWCYYGAEYHIVYVCGIVVDGEIQKSVVGSGRQWIADRHLLQRRATPWSPTWWESEQILRYSVFPLVLSVNETASWKWMETWFSTRPFQPRYVITGCFMSMWFSRLGICGCLHT